MKKLLMAFLLLQTLSFIDAPQAFALANCDKCTEPKTPGISRCFLCEVFKVSPKDTKNHNCDTAYCAYEARKNLPARKRFG